ncbi:ubiquitin-related domain-containing protein [Haematococcus lacustris]
MIEAAMLGLPYEPRLPLRGRSAGGRQAGARGGPPLGDPDLHDGRSLRWEQDQAYEESLAADKAKADSSAEAAREAAAAARRLAEEAAAAERAAAEAAAKLKATLARKAAALVPEPAPGDPEAVTIMVRLPDGMRLSRKFKKSNALQAVFDYVDVQHQAATYLPGRYNLVNQFPRRVFQESDATGTLADMGIVSGTALFLEVVQ